MSDIDYSKFSYRDYKKSQRGIRSRRGKVRYNFVNYDEYRKYNSQNEDNIKEEDVKGNDNTVKSERPDNENDDGEEVHKGSFPREINIEDLRTKKKQRVYQPREKMDKSNLKRDVIAVLMVVLCFALTIVSADIISGGDLFKNLAQVFNPESDVPVYYAVEVGSYSTVEEARAAGDVYRDRGAGGFVINDGSYRVIVAVYKNKEDADSIIEKLINDGLSGTIYEIKGAKVNFDKFGDIGPDLEAAALYCEKMYGQLYDLSNRLDKLEITENDAKIEIQMLYEETEASKETLITKTLNYSNDEIVLMVRAELSACAAILENLNDENIERPSLLADIRYSYTMIITSYCRLLRTLK